MTIHKACRVLRDVRIHPLGDIAQFGKQGLLDQKTSAIAERLQRIRQHPAHVVVVVDHQHGGRRRFLQLVAGALLRLWL